MKITNKCKKARRKFLLGRKTWRGINFTNHGALPRNGPIRPKAIFPFCQLSCFSSPSKFEIFIRNWELGGLVLPRNGPIQWISAPNLLLSCLATKMCCALQQMRNVCRVRTLWTFWCRGVKYRSLSLLCRKLSYLSITQCPVKY